MELDYIELLISKGLNLTLLPQEVTCLLLHGWHPATGNKSKPRPDMIELERAYNLCPTPSLSCVNNPCEFDIRSTNGSRWRGPALAHISFKITIHSTWVRTTTTWNRLPSVTFSPFIRPHRAIQPMFPQKMRLYWTHTWLFVVGWGAWAVLQRG